MQVPYRYSQSQSDVLFALINQSNPGLNLHPLTPADVRTLTPTAITPTTGTIQDTTVALLTKSSTTNYYGKQTVAYRRISLASFLKGLPVTSGWPTVNVSGYSATTYLLSSALTEINTKYGLALSLTDFSSVSASTALTSGSSVILTIAPTSLCYAPGGAFTILWTRPKQPLNAVISAVPALLTGRNYPGGNSFPTDGSRKPQGDFFTYGSDFTPIASNIAALAASGTNADFTTAALAPVLQYLQKMRPDLNFTSAASTTTGGLNGISFARYTIPSASAPNANSVKFANVLVLSAVSGSWFQGAIYLHYNVNSTAGVPTAEGFYLDANAELTQLLIGAGAVAASLGVKDTATGYSVTGTRVTKGSDNVSQNTKLRIQAASANTVYGGFVDVFMNRLDLGALTNFSPYLVSMPPSVSVMTVLAKIRDQYGIQLLAADINDVQTVDRDGDGRFTTVALTATAASVAWQGTVTLTFAGLPDISNAFFSTTLTGF